VTDRPTAGFAAGGPVGSDAIRYRRVQYETAGLDVDDVDPDPVVQWQRWHADAFEAGVAEPNAMTLGTVDADGTPDARLVLVRGAEERGFEFFTNYNSVKSRQLEALGAASAVFSWLDLHRQVRVRGSVERLDAESSDEYFATRPRESQIGAWASPQSEVIADRTELERLVAAVEERFAASDVPRPPHWGGWLLHPDVFEFWQGRPSRLHDRIRYRRVGGAWEITRLAP
jgi:pyridoxamine 5'-phosphate oxidase